MSEQVRFEAGEKMMFVKYCINKESNSLCMCDPHADRVLVMKDEMIFSARRPGWLQRHDAITSDDEAPDERSMMTKLLSRCKSDT